MPKGVIRYNLTLKEHVGTRTEMISGLQKPDSLCDGCLACTTSLLDVLCDLAST